MVDVLRIISGGEANAKYEVNAFELFYVNTLEFFSNIFYLFALTICLHITRKIRFKKILREEVQNNIALVIAFLSIFTLLSSFFFKNALWLFYPFISATGGLFAVVLLIRKFSFKSPYLYVGLLTLLLILFYNVMLGLRGTIVGLVIWTVFLLWEPIMRAKRSLFLALCCGLFLLFAQSEFTKVKKVMFYAIIQGKVNINDGFIPFFNYYREKRKELEKNTTYTKTSPFEKIGAIAKELEFRYGAPSLFGVGLVRLRHAGEKANFNPILNSFYSFLPRQIVGNDKPYPGSIDGTKHGMGMYRSVSGVTGEKRAFMTDFHTSTHYYWELGWLGIAFLSIIPAMYNVLIIRIAEKWGFVGLVVLALSFKPYWFLPKMWLSEIITMLATSMLPAIFFIGLIIFLHYPFYKKIHF